MTGSSVAEKEPFHHVLIKKVAQSMEGMGWKLMKIHVNIHMYLDIWLYGMPREHDTGCWRDLVPRYQGLGFIRDAYSSCPCRD